MLSEFLHLVDHSTLRLVLLTLHPALGLVALFLLSRLFFLAFSKSGSSSWHSQFLLSFFACGAGPHIHASGCFQKTRKLPARFARLACVPLIVVATASPASTATKTFCTASATAPGLVRLRLCFVDLQRASTQFCSVQCRNRLVGFSGIRHFHESKSTCASCFPISHDADFFHRTV